MTNILILLFSLTLIYLMTGARIKTYANALALQGILLFGIAYLELQSLREIHYSNLLFILFETLLFKGIVVPYYLYYLIKKNNISYEREPNVTNFYSLFGITLIFILSFFIGYKLHDEEFELQMGYRLGAHTLSIIYFTSSLATIFTGLVIVMNRKKIITHMVGYLVLENGLFMLSLAMGNEMPLIVNLGILFDIVTTVFLLGLFLGKVQAAYNDTHINRLSELKD